MLTVTVFQTDWNDGLAAAALVKSKGGPVPGFRYWPITACLTTDQSHCRSHRSSQEDHDGVHRRRPHRSRENDVGGVDNHGKLAGDGQEDDWSGCYVRYAEGSRLIVSLCDPARSNLIK